MGMIAAIAFICTAPVAVDGDSLRCAGQRHARLLGIDAQELAGHFRLGWLHARCSALRSEICLAQ